MEEMLFLSLAEVIAIHRDQIERYGGHPGVSGFNLLSSALAMPEAAFNGEFMHPDVYEMAAAYAFHICKNHPFIDGNKRTALVCALVFLEINRVSLADLKGILYGAMIDVAAGKLDKKGLARIFRELSNQDQG